MEPILNLVVAKIPCVFCGVGGQLPNSTNTGYRASINSRLGHSIMGQLCNVLKDQKVVE